MIKIGSVVQLNQGDTKANWVVVELEENNEHDRFARVAVVHEDELNCSPQWAYKLMFKESNISQKDRALLLHAFADTKHGKEIIKALTQ